VEKGGRKKVRLKLQMIILRPQVQILLQKHLHHGIVVLQELWQRNPRKPPPPQSPSNLMEIEEDSVLHDASTQQPEHMAISPATMTRSATFSTPDMLRSNDNTEGSPLQARTLFSAAITTETSQALTDTPEQALKTMLSASTTSSAPKDIRQTAAMTTATHTPPVTLALNHIEVFPYGRRASLAG